MLGRRTPQANGHGQVHENGASSHPITLLTIVGETAKMEGKFDIADSIQIECQVGGQLNVGGKLVIGEKGVVSADVQTVDAVIMGVYEGNMVATGNVEIAATGRVSGNIRTDSLVISKGGFFNGNVVKINAEGGNAKPVYLVDEKATHNPGGRNRGERGNGGDRGGRYAVEEER
ncbi:MAG: polymer-forming cytoskeletal protein [Candidatus Rokubacteria bacterium]|nr:polymer-forming cytoskeletal protein [Candidatus Rokubacteria bacterium]